MNRNLLAALAAAPVAATLLAPAARADAEQDQRYIEMLDRDGVHWTTVEHASAAGLAICDHLERGDSFGDVVIGVMLGNPADTQAQASNAITDARAVYCPDTPIH